MGPVTTHEEPEGQRYGSLLLDEQLCFALYAAQRAVTAAYRPLLDELGLTYPQYLVMLCLWERGETTVKDLAGALRLDYGTVSPLLKRLESAGLLRRERSLRDERSVSVALTGRGEQLRDRAAAVPTTLAAATGLDGPEVARLRAELWELTAHAAKAAGR
ncbi:MarR family transcriptional regulator [Streptomyces sp. CA-210063]|uniref:MarR family winged helix-turn-helix transcriptional regulator n=1 Tax=Streptomyces sp. CA-210063 TaxID=2801029 RepID=UPI00214BE110|nr:MarR family transcriptional regulator [Streptomyces sp. CA-210063]UUU33307.1 MarR family transcriptional regulator [Streptomyces sp. CA-210063]